MAKGNRLMLTGDEGRVDRLMHTGSDEATESLERWPDRQRHGRATRVGRMGRGL